MNRFTYLLNAIQAKLYKKKSWIVSAFAITQEDTDAYKKDPTPFRLVRTPTGVFFVSGENLDTLERIDDAVPNQPLFSFQDRIKIDQIWSPNITGEIETTVGQLLFNLICIVHAFGSKFPYVNGRVNLKKIEDQIASKLQDTPEVESERSNEFFYVDEYVKFVNALTFLTGFSQLCVWAATPKTMVAPTGFKEFKAQLLEKYKGKLDDPVELQKFEKELQAFDDAYLKDDPAYGTFISGKVKDVSRKRMFLTMGSAEGFTQSLDANPVVNSLEEGNPTDAKTLTAIMNAQRVGSYSRGVETIKGGVSAKVLLRSAGNMKVVRSDCETDLGIRRQFEINDIDQLVGRYVKTTSGWLNIDTIETAKKYVDRPLIVRSPLYCQLDDDNVCEICAGKKLAENPTGIATALTEISSIVLTTNMKRMHGVALTVAKLDYKKVFS